MRKLAARVKNLLLSPRTEWDVIADEAVEPRNLILRYVAPLSALPAVAAVIGLSGLGVRLGGEIYRAPIWGVLASAVLFFALAVGGVFAFAWIVDRLAPIFGGARDYRQALKLSAYSITAAMLAGAVTVVPALGVVALMGAVYSLYLLFIGTPRVMNPPPEGALNFAIVATACAVGVSLIVGLASMSMARVQGALFPSIQHIRALMADETPAGAAPATPQVPGASAGLATAEQFKTVAPLNLAGFERVSLSVDQRGEADARHLFLEAEYRRGRKFILVEIVNAATIAAVIGFGGPSTSEYDRETADGYARRRRAGETFVVEEWNTASRTGSYARLVGETYYVRASGGGGALAQELKAAADYFSAERLAALAAPR
jgi:hypothetical protein